MIEKLLRHTLVLALLFVALTSCGDDDDDDDNNNDDQNLTLSEGDYTGIWNSTTASASFNDIAISARISEVSPGTFEGPFFISGNFTSCCGSGANDGTISFTISDETVEGFEWDDIIPNCEGTFNGQGVITAEDAFRISFTGTDCDGDHTGSLILSK